MHLLLPPKMWCFSASLTAQGKQIVLLGAPGPFFPINAYSLGKYFLAPILHSCQIQVGGLIWNYVHSRVQQAKWKWKLWWSGGQVKSLRILYKEWSLHTYCPNNILVGATKNYYLSSGCKNFLPALNFRRIRQENEVRWETTSQNKLSWYTLY